MDSTRFDDDIWLLDRITGGSEYDLHLAFWPGENQRVLIKAIRPVTDEIKKKRIESRLLKEAATLEEFWSPYFPKVFDIRRNSEGVLYLILEYFEGVSLRQYLDINLENGLTLKIAERINAELSHALHYLHVKKNIIHFDLSPENIIISPENKIHLIDFEDAKIIGKKIAAKNIRGKDRYMAPELKGGPTEIIASVFFDEYAKKVIFKEMLSLCSPWDRLRNNFLKKPHRPHFQLNQQRASLFSRATLFLSLILITLLTLTFGPFYQVQKTVKNTLKKTTKASPKPEIKRSAHLKKASRKPAIPRVQIVKRKSSAVKRKKRNKKRSKKKSNSFQTRFQKVIATQDTNLKACLAPLNKKEVLIGFVLQQGTGRLLKLKTKGDISKNPSVSSCISRLYKNLSYPVHPSQKQVEITQRFTIVTKS